MDEFNRLNKEYPKQVALFFIPINTLFCFLFFRRSKLNFSEHLVLNTYKACGTFIITLLLTSVSIFIYDRSVFLVAYNIGTLCVIIYGCWFYYQYFSVYNYKKRNLIIRSLLATFLPGFIVGFVFSTGYFVWKLVFLP